MQQSQSFDRQCEGDPTDVDDQMCMGPATASLMETVAASLGDGRRNRGANILRGTCFGSARLCPRRSCFLDDLGTSFMGSCEPVGIGEHAAVYGPPSGSKMSGSLRAAVARADQYT
jgi:hypothetical protein